MEKQVPPDDLAQVIPGGLVDATLPHVELDVRATYTTA
jgi:hypothetical protein